MRVLNISIVLHSHFFKIKRNIAINSEFTVYHCETVKAC